MLKTVAISANKKTGPIAVTYRAGCENTFGTCPNTCALNPNKHAAAPIVDVEYMQAVKKAVPRNGIAWTYSHFPAEALPLPKNRETVFNYSADDMREAVRAVEMGRPAVYAAPKDTAEQWPRTFQGVKFVRCPAELADNFTCQQCGKGRPLCARGGRDYVIVFVAHGTGAKRVGTGDGGCYAASGPTAIQWHKTRETGAPDDAGAVRAFARALPPGSFLRHHIAGDIGAENKIL